MITFGNISLTNFNSVQMVVLGDGVSTQLKMNLSKPPFNLNFQGTVPNGFTVDLGQVDLGHATAHIDSTIDGDILCIVYDIAPSATVTHGPSITFVYNSLI